MSASIISWPAISQSLCSDPLNHMIKSESLSSKAQKEMKTALKMYRVTPYFLVLSLIPVQNMDNTFFLRYSFINVQTNVASKKFFFFFLEVRLYKTYYFKYCLMMYRVTSYFLVLSLIPVQNMDNTFFFYDIVLKMCRKMWLQRSFSFFFSWSTFI